MSIDRKQLRELVIALRDGGVCDVDATVRGLRELGAVPRINEGLAGMANGSDKCVEWYAGQVLDILEAKAFYAVNSLVNTLDMFCPEVVS